MSLQVTHLSLHQVRANIYVNILSGVAETVALINCCVFYEGKQTLMYGSEEGNFFR